MTNAKGQGCIATGADARQAEANIKTAIRMHLDGMREDGIAAPEPSSIVEYVAA